MKARLIGFGKWPVAGIAISAMVVLTYWLQNVLRLGSESIWPTLAAVVGLATAVTALLVLLTRRRDRATIAAVLIAAYMFYVPTLTETFSPRPLVSLFVHIAAIGALFAIYRKIRGNHEQLPERAGWLNLVCLAMLGVTALTVAVRVSLLEAARSNASAALPSLQGTAQADSPDVWHILFDRYAANSTLQARYGYDNSPFLDELRKRGFQVSEHAFSNYQRTGPSVASTMNGTLLDPLSKPMAHQQDDWVPMYRIMRDSAAIRQFNAMGYRTIFAGSWWEPTRFSSTASETIQVRALPEIARLVIDRSAIGFWFANTSMPWLNGRNDQCYRVNEKVRQLVKIAQTDERKMVFAHFLVPHPPFVLNADGSCRSLRTALKASRRDNYVGQIELANSKALALIDAILDGPRPAVIVLHSDEGPWPEPYVGNEHGIGTDPVTVPWGDLNSEQLHEKFAILMAMRDPQGEMPQTMPSSPVQIYPAILHDYFQSPASIPPSRSFVYKSEEALYQFEEVSARLQPPGEVAHPPALASAEGLQAGR